MIGKTVCGWLVACGIVTSVGCSGCSSTPKEPPPQKVDTGSIYKEEGREAARSGIPETACPYSYWYSRQQWLQGWIEETKKMKKGQQ